MKKIFVGVLCFILMMSFLRNVKAVENKDLFISHYETEIPVIEIDGTPERLYKQFVDHKLALNSFVEEHAEFFEQLADEYEVGKISLNNWKPYRDIAFMLYYTDPTNELYDKMASFFDVFENIFKNDLAKIKIANHDYERLEYLLPYNSGYVKKVLGEPINLDELDIEEVISLKESSSSNRSVGFPNNLAAINYAIQYATRPNTSSYEYFNGGDCANFVSQIIEAGGVEQDVYTSTAMGWWHRTNGFSHQHSLSWTVADDFVRYMGISYQSWDHFYFSASINSGDIIANDDDSDGDWDHVGFVVVADNYADWYSGKLYYDYKVAQHTRNYLEWTSSSNNNWETSGGKYAIVR